MERVSQQQSIHSILHAQKTNTFHLREDRKMSARVRGGAELLTSIVDENHHKQCKATEGIQTLKSWGFLDSF